MNDSDTWRRRRFYRSREHAIIAGVCAGFADYFGFNLKVTRILVVIAFFMALLSFVESQPRAS